MQYKINTDNQYVGKGFGEIVTDTELDGWDITHLVKIGSLVPVEVSSKKESN